jgi:hypothetical protein
MVWKTLGQPIPSKLSQICQAWSFCFLGLGFIVRKKTQTYLSPEFQNFVVLQAFSWKLSRFANRQELIECRMANQEPLLRNATAL